MRLPFGIVVAILALYLVAGHTTTAMAQEEGTPPVTILPVPTVTTPAAPESPADQPPSTVQEPLSPAATSPVEDTRPPTTGDTFGVKAEPGGQGYLWWFGALAGAGISSIVYGWMVARRAGASGGYEALGIVQESGSHGPDSIFMMRNGPFDDVEGAMESASSASILWSPTNDERHLWWIIRSVQTGEVVEIIGPLGAHGEEGQSRAKPPQLIVDLTERAPTRAS